MDNTDQSWPPEGFEDQGQCLVDISDDAIRTTFIQIARSSIGLRSPNKVFLNLCYPFDKPKTQLAMAMTQHACAITMGGVLRSAGCLHAKLMGPYVGRNDAFSRVEEVARAYSAWGGHDADFHPGDIIIMGTDVPRDAPNRSQIISQWGTPGHMCLVETIDDEETGEFTTIDGGLNTAIHRTKRNFYRANGALWVTGFTTRRVWGTVLVDKLQFDSNWCLPKGPGYPGLNVDSFFLG